MSDLAPFVVATIRDQVVTDQQDEIGELSSENAKLKRLLHERHPVRSLQLVITKDGIKQIIQNSTVYIPNAIDYQHLEGPEFPATMLPEEEELITYDVNLRDLLMHGEIWIDGSCAIVLKDVTIKFCRLCWYSYTDDEGNRKLFFYTWFTLEDDEDNFNWRFHIPNVGPNGHCNVLNLEPQTDPNIENYEGNPLDIIGRDQPYANSVIDLNHLLNVHGDDTVRYGLDYFFCNANWFMSKLTVPYKPVEENDAPFYALVAQTTSKIVKSTK